MSSNSANEPGNSPFFTSAARWRKRSGPGRAALVGSLLMHILIIAAAIGTGAIKRGTEQVTNYKFYSVKIFSPPPQVAGEPTAPAPRPAIIKPKTEEVKTIKAPVKKPDTKTASRQTAPAPKTSKAPVAGRNPKPGSTGGEGLDIDLEGEPFPYPDYLENIIIQLNRYFRWTGAGNLEAHVGFYILRDGSVRAVKVQRGSGNFRFDLAAMSAIEEAGNRKLFGPLPGGFVRDTLPVLFKFIPPS
jgi:outer membrane biosynthesis protein TonB